MSVHKNAAIAVLFGIIAVAAICVFTPAPRGNVSGGSISSEEAREASQGKTEGNAWDVFQWWYGTRAYPNELIPKSSFFDAWQYARTAIQPISQDNGGLWTSLGPTNVGGRVLSLAIDPTNDQVVWAGSASGGLWKSTTGGEGASAWTRVDTGFPSLAVSTILLDNTNPQTMYIGTGEISLYTHGMVGTPGARTSYGIGVLKSTDGGSTWQMTGLNWTLDQHRAVEALRMDPANNETIWAATSEGLYKSTNGGITFNLSHNVLMAMDVAVNPKNSQMVFVSHGQLNSTPNPGIYRTTDGGTTWTQLGGGLPTSNFGRTPLIISAPLLNGNPIVYAGVSDASSSAVVGLFKSTDLGITWTDAAAVNWAGGQAWYDNAIGVSPFNPNLVLCGGLDWYRSVHGGSGLGEVTFWYLGYGGVIPPGGAEGPGNYVHADDHAIAFDPTNSNVVYVGCDGGVFKSTNAGVNWAGKNGGFVTTQIYNGLAVGYTASPISVAGLQDNGTILYTGNPAWSKVYGGDGGYCGIDKGNQNTMYEEYVDLDISRSTDGGNNWSEILPSPGGANFIAPFSVSESSPNILYAGATGILKSTDRGNTWFYPDGVTSWNGTAMATIGLSFTSPDTLVAGTGSGSTGAVVQIKRSVNGGVSWTDVTSQLPNRFPTDITFNRVNGRNVWITFSGYGTSHVFSSDDAGATWTDRTGNLPDIPAQSVAIDPQNPAWVYIGTDLGVFMTTDEGTTWSGYNSGMPTAMVLDLVVNPAERKMRAATFGNGIYEAPLYDQSASTGGPLASRGGSRLDLLPGGAPNPFREATAVRFSLAQASDLHAAVYDVAGRLVRTLAGGLRPAGVSELSWDGRSESGTRVAAGAYFVRLQAAGETKTSKVVRID